MSILVCLPTKRAASSTRAANAMRKPGTESNEKYQKGDQRKQFSAQMGKTYAGTYKQYLPNPTVMSRQYSH
jgi:hypothetical protein